DPGPTGAAGPGGPAGPSGPVGPTGAPGLGAISFNVVTNAATTATIATINGWTFAVTCTPTDGTTTTRLGIFATPPSGGFFNTRGTNPWQQDGLGGPGGTPFLAISVPTA